MTRKTLDSMAEMPESAAGGSGRNRRGSASGASNVTAGKENGDPSEQRMLEEVVERENMRAAYQQVKRNAGAPGTDGMSVEELGPHLREEWQRIKLDVPNRTAFTAQIAFAPLPARSVSGSIRPNHLLSLTNQCGIQHRYGRSGGDPRRARRVPGWHRENGPYKPGGEVGKDARRAIGQPNSTGSAVKTERSRERRPGLAPEPR